MGNSVFQAMTQQLTQAATSIKISRQQYNTWRREFTWDSIRGRRYGESFCEYFDITNLVLTHTRDRHLADQIIRTHYVA